jgi:hypothetical protein
VDACRDAAITWRPMGQRRDARVRTSIRSTILEALGLVACEPPSGRVLAAAEAPKALGVVGVDAVEV